jgi:adenylate kinase
MIGRDGISSMVHVLLGRLCLVFCTVVIVAAYSNHGRLVHRISRPTFTKTLRRGGEMTMQTTKPVHYAPKIIIAGAPAAGKGTQCEQITSEFGLIHLSTGDILRAAVKEGTPLGKKAKEYMDGGKLVPDELIINVICDRLKQDDCKSCGWLLDGFPRTKAQADALSAAGMKPDCFLLLDVPEDILVERVVGRRTDPVTGKIYHLKFSPPENEEVASRLTQRSDDTEDKIRIRYKEFQNHAGEIRAAYADKIVDIDGTKGKEDISGRISDVLESAALRKLGIEVRK